MLAVDCHLLLGKHIIEKLGEPVFVTHVCVLSVPFVMNVHHLYMYILYGESNIYLNVCIIYYYGKLADSID